MTSSKREESSPILKKAGAALQLRSMYIPQRGFGINSSFSPTFIEHSTAGEGLPLFPPVSFFTHLTYDAPTLSTKATTKSKFCATAYVEYTQSRSAGGTTKTTIKVRNGGSRSSDAFRQPAEQCFSIIFIGTDTNSTPCTSTCTRARAPTAET
jgi:hypothetical protein